MRLGRVDETVGKSVAIVDRRNPVERRLLGQTCRTIEKLDCPLRVVCSHSLRCSAATRRPENVLVASLIPSVRYLALHVVRQRCHSQKGEGWQLRGRRCAHVRACSDIETVTVFSSTLSRCRVSVNAPSG
jgi:hypothetical protein